MSQTLIERQPVAPASSPKMTYEEFLENYDGIRAEWIDGEVQLMSPVSNAHQRIGNFLFRVISDFVEAYDIGAVFQLEFQMKLVRERRGREPDLFFVASENLSRLKPNFLDGPADLVVEIISPESIERDRVDKFAEYQSGGVREYWLIDPLTQEASFFVLDEKGRYQAISANAEGIYQSFVAISANAEGIYQSFVLEGLWLKIDWLWQSPPPPMFAVRKELGLP